MRCTGCLQKCRKQICQVQSETKIGTKCIIFMIHMCEESRSIVFLNDISYTGQDFFMINFCKRRPYATELSSN